MIKKIKNARDVNKIIIEWKKNNYKIAVVPTMGSIHEGHLSLVKIASQKADKVIVSIYVNPTQFSKNEDYNTYPRNIDRDISYLSSFKKCEIVYIPSNMYNNDHATTIKLSGPAEGLDSETRPHFFPAVATIVLKLLNQLPSDFAIFGEKDYQQFRVIEQMVKDLNMPIQILLGKTIRNKNGLALSSRNSYLNHNEIKIAPKLFEIMKETCEEIRGSKDSKVILKNSISNLKKVGFSKIDYLKICDNLTLEELESSRKNARLFAAVWLGKTRLTDNMQI